MILSTLLAAAGIASSQTLLSSRHDFPREGREVIVISEHGAHRPHAAFLVRREGSGTASYLVDNDELFTLAIDNPEEQLISRLYGLGHEGLEYQWSDRQQEPTVSRWSDPAGARALSAAVDLLVQKGKRPSPADCADRARGLERKADSLTTRRQALATAESVAPGSVKDAGELEALQGRIEAADGRRQRSSASCGEAAAAARAGNRLAQAFAEWEARRAAREADRGLTQAENILDSLPARR